MQAARHCEDSMDRRGFVKLCGGSAAAFALADWTHRAAAAEFEAAPPARLVDRGGVPLKAADIPVGEALVFAYPMAGVPCFLINLGDRAARSAAALHNDEGDYAWPGGVGPKGRYVAFVAICTHQMSYPQPEVSYLRYAASDSELAGAPGRIVCCAHASVFDPAEGARVTGGPAPMPLLPVRLAYAAASDGLTANGILGMAFVQRFFKTYKADLNARFGPGGYREAVGDATACVPLSGYSGSVPAC